MDTYQPIYDGVRSKLTNCDVGNAIANVVRSSFDISHLLPLAQQEIANVGYQWGRPSVVHRPILSRDGNAWIALLGNNLQEGVVGVGDSPNEAMEDFDKQWFAKIK